MNEYDEQAPLNTMCPWFWVRGTDFHESPCPPDFRGHDLASMHTIGVGQRWRQEPPQHDTHDDIALSKRALALESGATAVTCRQAAAMNLRRRITGQLDEPDDAAAWHGKHIRQPMAARKRRLSR